MNSRAIPAVLIPALLAVVYGYLCYMIFEGVFFDLDAFTWSFVMLMPYSVGALATYLAHRRHESRHDTPYNIIFALIVPWLAVILLFFVAVVISFGVLLCLIISVPIMFPAASLGGLTVWLLRRQPKAAALLVTVALLAPFFTQSVEAQFEIPRQLTTTHTQIRIEAPIEDIWANIKTVPAITDDEQRFDWLHQVGLPRPVAATLSHEGIGGVRDATFENGLRFDETITEWEHHERISFTIVETSQELLPAPLHLIDGETFDVVEGTYEIEALADGSYMLHLSSEHFLQTRFNSYGSYWTDLIMRDLQNYILEIVKLRAEA